MNNSYKQSLYVGIIRVMANVIMLIALFWAMYQASHSPYGSLSTVCLWFFGISIPAWVCAGYLIRYVRKHFPVSDSLSGENLEQV